MTFPSSEQLHRVVYSIWDFQQALSALTFLMEDCDQEKKYTKIELRRLRCYETQAIISFCRPFSASRAGVQLNSKALGLTLNADEKALKKELIYIRNKIVAHSDEKEMHYKSVTVEIDGDSEYKAPYFIFDESLYLNIEQWHMLESLLQRLIHALIKYTFNLCELSPERFEEYRIPKSMVDQIRKAKNE